ncbi:MAG: hypothetical protein ACPGNT_00870, partial [Rhodospirillales bacterium]
MSTILTQTSRSAVTANQLLGQLQTQQTKKLEDQTKSVQASYQTKINSVTREQDQWRSVKADVGEASSELSSTVGRLKSMRSRLDAEVLNINKLNTRISEGDTVNIDLYAYGFDATVKALDGIAKSGSPRLTGDDNAKLSYKIDPYGQQSEVQGVALTSDYYIIDSNGDRWQLDRQGGNLKRYTDYPNGATSDVGGLKGGLQLDTLSGDQITFTINPNTADPKQFSGTIKSSGSGLKDSWFYGNLASADNRTSALTDLKSARTAVELEIARYDVARTMAVFYETRANEEISGRRDTIT